MHVWHRYNRKSHVCTFLIYGEGFERMKKVFIFGIGGFAGSYLAQEFIDNSSEILIPVENRSSAIAASLKAFRL